VTSLVGSKGVTIIFLDVPVISYLYGVLFHCQVLAHSLSAYPYFAHQLTTEQEQASMASQRSKIDPFSPYYNLGWRNHPNFSWNNGPML